MSNDAAGLLMQRVSKTKRAELKWGFDELDIALEVDERIPHATLRWLLQSVTCKDMSLPSRPDKDVNGRYKSYV